VALHPTLYREFISSRRREMRWPKEHRIKAVDDSSKSRSAMASAVIGSISAAGGPGGDNPELSAVVTLFI